jgi:DNA polymerase-4
VQLKVRYRDFTTVTRSCTLPAATDRGTDLVHTAWEMLERLPVDQGVRLLGVGVSNLGREPVAHQLRLDDAGSADWDAANEAVDAIRDRFGAQLIRPARLAGRPERSQSAQWGPDGSGGRPPPSAENPPADRSGRDRSG